MEGEEAAPAEPPPSQNRSVPPVSYEEATAKIGVLPNLASRPTATDIRAFTSAFCDRVTGIPSYQSADFGYIKMVEEKRCVPSRDHSIGSITQT